MLSFLLMLLRVIFETRFLLPFVTLHTPPFVFREHANIVAETIFLVKRIIVRIRFDFSNQTCLVPVNKCLVGLNTP